MPTNCEIIIENNEERVYYGGQMIEGRVRLTLAKGKIVRGIYIEFLGRAYCEWVEGTGNRKETYTGTETYLEERQYFIGGRTGDLTVQPGLYEYTFSLTLPFGLPTSLEAQTGYIRYGLLLVLDRPRWPDQKFEESFTVIKPLDLNSDFSLRHPIVEEETKRFNPFCLFSCCASDPLFMIAAIPVSGYTPGQMINVDLELANNSNEYITAFVLKIIREVKFFICENSSTTFTERDAIAEVETRGCYAQQRQAYTVNFLVPPTPPTDSTSSKIVHVSYHLLIEGLTGCFHLNPTIKIPITIGSYPILDHLPNYINSIAPAVSNEIALRQQPTAQSTAERAPQSQSTIFPPSAPYPENDPPSYEQATTIGERKFAPNYPVYRRQTSYSSQNSTPVLQRHCNQ